MAIITFKMDISLFSFFRRQIDPISKGNSFIFDSRKDESEYGNSIWKGDSILFWRSWVEFAYVTRLEKKEGISRG